MGNFELKVEVREIPIGMLSENTGQIPDVPRNPRKITKEKFEDLCESIRKSPEMKVLDEIRVYPFNGRYVVISGNHRYKAYKKLGWENVLCKILPEDTPKVKLREYVLKENMQYAENDRDLLKSWNMKELANWGIVKIGSNLPIEHKDLSLDVKSLYQIAIDCKDEAEQERIYNEIKGKYKCRILTL